MNKISPTCARDVKINPNLQTLVNFGLSGKDATNVCEIGPILQTFKEFFLL